MGIQVKTPVLFYFETGKRRNRTNNESSYQVRMLLIAFLTAADIKGDSAI